MTAGKLGAQVAHASLAAILSQMTDYKSVLHPDVSSKDLELVNGTAIAEWIDGRFTKICVGVRTEAELLAVYEAAKAAGLITALICDNGPAFPVGTNTCVGIGPNWNDELLPVTGKLKLY